MAESIMHPYLANMQTTKELVIDRPKLAHVKKLVISAIGKQDNDQFRCCSKMKD